MDKEKIKQVYVLYEQVLGLIHGLSSTSVKGWLEGGPSQQYKNAIEELSNITEQDLSRFLPSQAQGWNNTCYDAGTLATQANSIASWLRATYFDDKPAHYAKPSTPINQVNVNQDVNVTVSVVVDIMNLLTDKEKEFAEGTKERTFITKLKEGLKGVRDTAAIMALIPQIAVQCGLTIAELHKIFS